MTVTSFMDNHTVVRKTVFDSDLALEDETRGNEFVLRFKNV